VVGPGRLGYFIFVVNVVILKKNEINNPNQIDFPFLKNYKYIKKNLFIMRKREIQVLIELLKNCKISDRQLAQKLKTSQSTITRTRKRLEKKTIKKYTALPDFSNLNINLISVTFGNCNRSKKDILECLETVSNRYPRIIYAGEGEGMGKTCMLISLHKDFSDYTKFKGECRLLCESIKNATESFLIPSNSFQTFDLGKPVENMLKEEKKRK